MNQLEHLRAESLVREARLRDSPQGARQGLADHMRWECAEGGYVWSRVGRGFLEERSLQLVYAACSATSQRAPTGGFWGPSLVSTSTRNQEAPALGSTSVLESNPTSRKSLCCLAQNPPPSPVPEGRVAGGHPDHNPRGGDQCPHLHLPDGFPLPGLA